MKKIIFTFLFLALSFYTVVAQKQTNVWYFGVNAGIDFNGGSPVAISGGQTSTNEGCAVISDSAGNLLFYTDGEMVWNKLHQQMPNGFGLAGGYHSSTQAAVIVPDPGADSLYYIFTVDEWGGTNGFSYSKLNILLDSGKGDVTVKNNFMLANAVEKITATYHGNNHDVWILVHVFGTNSFYAYLVTDAGVSNPVISNTGTVHQLVPDQNSVGQMKFNSCGNKLAVAIGYQDTIDIFDFDNLTGIVSGPQTLSFADHVYGVEFSRDNSKLYVSCYDPSSTLSQFDLNAATIQSSQVTLSVTSDIYALQLAPDGKIYAAKSFNQYLGVINFPDLQGISCDYVDLGFDTDPNFNGSIPALGLPGFIQSYFHPDFPNIQCNAPVANLQSSDTTLCEKKCIDFTDLTAGIVTNWLWLFPGAVPSSDTSQNPVNICYNNYGTYDVTLIVSNGAGSDTLFLPGFIKVLQSPAIPVVAVYGDTLISSSAAGYQWYLGTNAINGATQQIYISTQPGNYYVIISDSNGCQAASSVITVLSVQEDESENCFHIETRVSNNFIAIEMSGCRSKTVSFHIYNILGEEFYNSGKLNLSKGSFNATIPVRLSPSLYLLGIQADDFKITKKLLVY